MSVSVREQTTSIRLQYLILIRVADDEGKRLTNEDNVNIVELISTFIASSRVTSVFSETSFRMEMI